MIISPCFYWHKLQDENDGKVLKVTIKTVHVIFKFGKVEIWRTFFGGRSYSPCHSYSPWFMAFFFVLEWKNEQVNELCLSGVSLYKLIYSNAIKHTPSLHLVCKICQLGMCHKNDHKTGPVLFIFLQLTSSLSLQRRETRLCFEYELFMTVESNKELLLNYWYKKLSYV